MSDYVEDFNGNLLRLEAIGSRLLINPMRKKEEEKRTKNTRNAEK